MIARPAAPDLDHPAIEALIAKADAGDPRAWAYLCAWALHHDTVLYAAAKARAHAAVAAFAPSGPPLDMEIVDQVDSLPSFLLRVALYAPTIGYALAEMQYRRASFLVVDKARELLVVERLRLVDQSHVRFARSADEPMLASATGATPLPVDKFLMVLGAGDGIAVKRGYMRRAIFPVIERQQLLAKMTARAMEGGAETDKESKRFEDLSAEIVAIVMDGREHDAGLLGGVVLQLAKAVLRVNSEALAFGRGGGVLSQRATATIDTTSTCERDGCGATHKAQRVLDLGPWPESTPILVTRETPPGWHRLDGRLVCSIGCMALVIAEMERRTT